MKRTSVIALAVIWFALWLETSGALNANLRGKYPDLMQSPYHARSTLTVSMAFAIFPPAWILAPFLTGFFYFGWSLDGRPLPCVGDPKIWCQP